MPRPGPLRRSLRAFARRAGNAAAALPLRAAAALLPAVPTSAVFGAADALGTLLYALDARGRRAGRENLRLAFGDELPSAARRRILRASYRNVLVVEALLFHLRRLTPARFARFLRVAPEDEVFMRRRLAEAPSVVIVSGHFGNWELLLAARSVFDFAPPFVYLAETTGVPGVDEVFARLRDRGGGGAALRKHGAMAVKRALQEGQSAALLVDRNVRGNLGGIYAPFLGVLARTTPLPARLACWYRRPLVVLLAVPDGPRRWRLSMSDDLLADRTGDVDHDTRLGTTRVNEVLSRAIREHPEAWAWMLKRFKSRPTPELGPYPPYSLHDPEIA